ncbi:MAG: N-acetylmuramoyl-L-alanine amidase, partial [Verrucomicrobia bacterium]|nr:N-acetylmuramoyl-L-alanine amidase [Verrucomicrobiota bacterium]
GGSTESRPTSTDCGFTTPLFSAVHRGSFLSRAVLCLLLSVFSTALLADDAPRWGLLNQFQRTMTRAEFQSRLDRVFSPGGAFQKFLAYDGDGVSVFDDEQHQRRLYRLQLATDTRRVVKRTFKTLEELPALKNPPAQPLRGLRIVLDPGHIGGEFARMEERLFKLNGGPAEQETVQNLIVARLLAPQLQRAGATVLFTKNDFKPVTDATPEQFRELAAKYVRENVAPRPDVRAMGDLAREAFLLDATRKRMELEFYRNAEIRARAALVNERLRPDLTLCIHFNAIGDTDRPAADNRLLLIIHGGYSPDSVDTPQRKFELLWKLLENSHATELAAADAISRAMAADLKLPPERSKQDPNCAAVTGNPYVYARNLIANRLCHGPVIYLEPYYQNNPTTYARLLAGDYDGERNFDGQCLRSIFREYADAVARGVIEFYRRHTPATPAGQ